MNAAPIESPQQPQPAQSADQPKEWHTREELERLVHEINDHAEQRCAACGGGV